MMGVRNPKSGYTMTVKYGLGNAQTHKKPRRDWKCDREVYGTRLESVRGLKTTTGSNPVTSAILVSWPSPAYGTSFENWRV